MCVCVGARAEGKERRLPRTLANSKVREEQWETCRGGQTTQKAKLYIGNLLTSQPERVLTFSLVNNIREVSSEAKTSLRSSGYSSPYLAPRTAPRQQRQGCRPQGLFGYSRQPTFIFPKVPGRTFLPNPSKFVTSAAAPVALNPFVRNQCADAARRAAPPRRDYPLVEK